MRKCTSGKGNGKHSNKWMGKTQKEVVIYTKKTMDINSPQNNK